MKETQTGKFPHLILTFHIYSSNHSFAEKHVIKTIQVCIARTLLGQHKRIFLNYFMTCRCTVRLKILWKHAFKFFSKSLLLHFYNVYTSEKSLVLVIRRKCALPIFLFWYSAHREILYITFCLVHFVNISFYICVLYTCTVVECLYAAVIMYQGDKGKLYVLKMFIMYNICSLMKVCSKFINGAASVVFLFIWY